MSKARSGKLADDSRLCRSSKPVVAAAPAPWDDPNGSSSHNKDNGKPAKKDAPPHKRDGAGSKVGSSRHHEEADRQRREEREHEEAKRKGKQNVPPYQGRQKEREDQPRHNSDKLYMRPPPPPP